MKMKKEYLFLIVVIAALSLYLIFRNKDKTHYTLPELEVIEQAEITKIVISRADSSIILKRQDERWLIDPMGYPTDQAKVDKMLEAISAFTLTTLVSESKNYNPYDLTDDKKISIEVHGGDQILTTFDIGKAASTFRHTYVRVGEDPKVYQAKENIQRVFDQQVDRLRDKTAVKVDREAVTEITVVDSVGTLTMIKNIEPPVPDPATMGDSIAVEPQPPWQTADGREANEQNINRIITRIANLKCDSYIEGRTKDDFTDPIFTITVKADETVTLSIFQKEQEENKYPAISSANDYPFMLPDWAVKQMMQKREELIVEETNPRTQ